MPSNIAILILSTRWSPLLNLSNLIQPQVEELFLIVWISVHYLDAPDTPGICLSYNAVPLSARLLPYSDTAGSEGKILLPFIDFLLREWIYIPASNWGTVRLLWAVAITSVEVMVLASCSRVRFVTKGSKDGMEEYKTDLSSFIVRTVCDRNDESCACVSCEFGHRPRIYGLETILCCWVIRG